MQRISEDRRRNFKFWIHNCSGILPRESPRAWFLSRIEFMAQKLNEESQSSHRLEIMHNLTIHGSSTLGPSEQHLESLSADFRAESSSSLAVNVCRALVSFFVVWETAPLQISLSICVRHHQRASEKHHYENENTWASQGKQKREQWSMQTSGLQKRLAQYCFSVKDQSVFAKDVEIQNKSRGHGWSDKKTAISQENYGVLPSWWDDAYF